MKTFATYFVIRKGILLLILGSLISSCEPEGDEQVIRQFPLPPYEEIYLNSVFDVDIMEADEFTLEIQGRKDIVEAISFTVDQGVLTLQNTYGKLWLSPGNNKIKLLVTGKGLRKVHAQETCNIQSLNTITTDTFGLTLGGKLNIARLHVDCNFFYYYNTSPVGGKVYVGGHANQVGIYNGTLMEVDASELVCNVATVETSSKTDVQVFVQTQLYYSIRGTGNIYLYGNPGEIIPLELLSTGKLIRK